MLKRLFRLISKILKGDEVMIISQTAEVWDRQFEKGNWNFLLDLKHQPHVSRIAAWCKENLPNGARILDVGCGNGALINALNAIGVKAEYWGIDISKKAIEEVRIRHPEARVYTRDILDPQIDGVFDVIVFSEVLYYVPYVKAIQLYKHYLSKRGVMIVSLYSSWRTYVILVHSKVYLKWFHAERVNDHKGKIWNLRIGRPRFK